MHLQDVEDHLNRMDKEPLVQCGALSQSSSLLSPLEALLRPQFALAQSKTVPAIDGTDAIDDGLWLGS